MAVVVYEVGHHLRQHIGRVGHRAAKETGMKVFVGARNLYFHITQTAQAHGNSRNVGGNHAGVGSNHHVGFKHVFMRGAPRFQRGRANFFFAFEHKLDIAAKLPFLDQIFKSFEVNKALPLVVVGPARIHLAVFKHRLKRLGVPFFHRVHRHHVVVAIHQHRVRLGVYNFFAIYHRVAARGHHLGLVGAGFLYQLGQLLGAALHIGFVRRLGADGRNTQQVEPFGYKSLLVFFDVGFGGFHIVIRLGLSFRVGADWAYGAGRAPA